jgi:hypothetical protein
VGRYSHAQDVPNRAKLAGVPFIVISSSQVPHLSPSLNYSMLHLDATRCTCYSLSVMNRTGRAVGTLERGSRRRTRPGPWFSIQGSDPLRAGVRATAGGRCPYGGVPGRAAAHRRVSPLDREGTVGWWAACPYGARVEI